LPLTQQKRAELARLCRDRRRRNAAFSHERPTVWNPHNVNSAFGLPFTDVSAWAFIADLLEDGHEFDELIMGKPPGAIGYVIKHQISEGNVVYIKLELVGGYVWGRSFHPDQPPSV